MPKTFLWDDALGGDSPLERDVLDEGAPIGVGLHIPVQVVLSKLLQISSALWFTNYLRLLWWQTRLWNNQKDLKTKTYEKHDVDVVTFLQ